MYSLGMDLGTSTVKIVLMQNGTVEKYWLAVHHGRPLLCLRQGLSELAIGRDETLAVCVTGDNAGALLERCPVLSELGEIPAIVEGVRRLVPQAGSIIEIGSQGARFITEVQSRTLRSVCQNGYHSPPAGRCFHAGYPAGIVLCNDP